MRFLHAADLHIDSPLRGLEAYEGAPLQQLRAAPRQSAQNMVRLAIEQQVDFVVIAGDLFDGRWQDMRTGLWTAARFRELEDAGIRVFLLQGNHDAASKVRQAITWPGNVHVFATRQPETVVCEELGVAIHGQGFAREQVTDDLAAAYPDAVPGMWNIGVLHTSLTGSPDHDTYAPTRLAVLHGRGYDYWALGHIHARSEPPISERPYVAYSGNTQGRHIKETGPKGCFLVDVAAGELVRVTFQATDVLRWHRLEIPLQESDGRGELLDNVAERLDECHRAAEGRFVAVRLVIRGACRVHQQLAHDAERDEVVAEIRNLANSLDAEVWVEKVLFETLPAVDWERLRRGQDLMGELLRSFERHAADPDALRSLTTCLQPLIGKLGAEAIQIGIDCDDPAQLKYWLQQAQALLVSRLLEGQR